jgi:hypothetical protein
MMIEKDFAADLLEQIEIELDKFDNEIGIPKSENLLPLMNVYWRLIGFRIVKNS